VEVYDMDKSIRRNEICVIGLPRCDFVFSSTRTCFIAYGFQESSLEMMVLRRVIEEHGLQPVEAGGTLAPAQSAFCAKVCSKIITAQFCAVLLNNEESEGREVPNANVNMEYGLMLGFNKYVIPFQRSSQRLPFNVAGLDTIKYTNADFERLAAGAVAQATRETQQDAPPPFSPNQILEVFLLTKKALVTPMNTEGDRHIYQMGQPLGFNLLNDFSGLNYMFFGNFTTLRPEVILWRVRLLTEIFDERRASLTTRAQAGIGTAEQVFVLDQLFARLKVWLVVTTNEDKSSVEQALGASAYPVEVFSVADVASELEKLGKASA
jgi:hypothetical protein